MHCLWTDGLLFSLFCQVWIHDDSSTLDEDYDLCAQTSNVAEVPSAGYFGISAATGGLSGMRGGGRGRERERERGGGRELELHKQGDYFR